MIFVTRTQRTIEEHQISNYQKWLAVDENSSKVGWNGRFPLHR